MTAGSRRLTTADGRPQTADDRSSSTGHRSPITDHLPPSTPRVRGGRRPLARSLLACTFAAVFALSLAVGSAWAAGGPPPRHRVQPGETLTSIAEQLGSTVPAIVAANRLANPDQIAAGQILVVPPAYAPLLSIVVGPQDTLSGIARRYHSNAEDLAALNGIALRERLEPGQDLLVPAPAGKPSPALPPGNAAGLQQNTALGRLNASSIDGDLDGDGDYDRLMVYGSRSFSVWDAAGNLVWDSGSELERITADLTPALFNANDGDPGRWDERSDDKGPEPEGVTTGVVAGRPYAFVGLERAGGGVMVYDLSNPRQPIFVQYVRSDADISPEGVLFIPAENSPTGRALLVLTHEVSNTTTIYEVQGPIFGLYLPFIRR